MIKINRGFTLIEILTVIGIFIVIFSLTFYFFGGLDKRESLEKDVAGVTALIRNARILSIASKNASVFGIHFESDKAVLFEGSTYTSGGQNEKIINLSRKVYISSYSLNNGGQDIVFSRLVGDTTNFGTVTLSLKDNSTSTTITILKTGVIQ
jgi:prepilin-type N-terminal cleavage/methylation domain-containing protein